MEKNMLKREGARSQGGSLPARRREHKCLFFFCAGSIRRARWMGQTARRGADEGGRGRGRPRHGQRREGDDTCRVFFVR